MYQYIMLVECPHCDVWIEILEVNCAIFRCGILKDTGEQINPHLPKKECDDLKKEDKIWGCSRPFKYEGGKAVVCEYL
jgi:hypothetical protein